MLESQSLPQTPKYMQDDDLTQESKDFISTLPREKGLVSTFVYQHQGFWFSSRILQGLLACQKNFRARDTDVFVVTSPKTGTTWLKALVYATVNRSRFPVTQHQHHPLLTANPHELVPFLETQLYAEKLVPNPNLDSIFNDPIRAFGTHLPYISLPETVKKSTCKIVYLCRNPKDTFVSLWFFTNKLRPVENGTNSLEEAFDKFCNGKNMFGPFWDHVLAYWKLSKEMPHKVLFLKYEELKKEPIVHVKRLGEFLGFPFSIEEEDIEINGIIKLCSFGNLSTLEVNKTGELPSGLKNSDFFRRGEVDDSMNYLTGEMIDRLDQITKEKFGGFDLKF